MRLLAVILMFPIWCHAAANCFAHASTSSTSTSPSMNTTGATLLVAVVSSYSGFNQVLTDSVGTRDWSTTSEYDAQGTGGGVFHIVLYKPNPVTSTTYTFSIPAQPGLAFQAATVWACSGTATDLYVMTAQVGLYSSASSTNWQPGAVTPQEAGDLLFAAGSTPNSGGTTASIDSGYSTPVINDDGTDAATISSWQSAAGTTAVNPTWTTNKSGWSGSQVLFRATGVAPPTGSGGTINNLAGTGRMDFGGDAGAAVNAYLNYPGGGVKTSTGLICIPDVNNNVIRCINPTTSSITAYGRTISPNAIDTIAGNGTQNFLDGPLLNAEFAHPAALAIDPSDCIYVADQQTHRIRKFCTSGNVSTVAGGGPGGTSTNAVCGTLPYKGFAGDGGPATSALMYCPQGVIIDSAGNIIISDSNNERVRVVNTQSSTQTLYGVSVCAGCIQTVLGGVAQACSIASSGTTSFVAVPLVLSVDSSNNLFIAVEGCHQIWKLTPAGVPSIVAGISAGYSGDGGLATSAQLRTPFGVFANPTNDDLYIADTGNSVIRFVDHTTGNISTIGGHYNVYPFNSHTYTGSGGYCCDTGFATLAGLMYPVGAWPDLTAGKLYISDLFNSRVRWMTITPGGGGGGGGGGGAGGGVFIAASARWVSGAMFGRVGAAQPIYGGPGQPGATSSVTLSGTTVTLSTGDVLAQLQNSPETVGQSWSFTTTNQVIYLILFGGTHTFTDANTGFPFAFNSPLAVSVGGVSMYMYQSTNPLYGTYKPKIAS